MIIINKNMFNNNMMMIIGYKFLNIMKIFYIEMNYKNTISNKGLEDKIKISRSSRNNLLINVKFFLI